MISKQLIRGWALPVVIVIAATVVLLLGEDAALRLRYDRAGIGGGEILRLISGHAVHLEFTHYLLNVAGLLVVWYLVGDAFPTRAWAVIIVTSILTMDAGFWFLMPTLAWYVGLSGLLHGLLAAGISGIWRTRRFEALVIAVLILGKLVYESLIGPLPGSESVAGGDVVTAAHLLGAIGGFVAGLAITVRVRDINAYGAKNE